MTLLGIDTENTGLLPGTQPLTLYMGVLDENFKIIQALDLKVKPDPIEGRTVYSHIEVEALVVNKINLIDHDKVATTYKQAKTIVYKWLEDMQSIYGELTPFGNMVGGDINKICEYLISRGSWDGFCDRRVIELTSVGKTLQLLGRIPEKQSLSLSKISEYFGMKVDNNMLHTARYDVEVGAFVLKNYLELLK
jgi:hypothetical protein